jgi:hypothetical protein
MSIGSLSLPGSIHDSKASAVIGQFYNILESVYRRNDGKCTADSAFAAKNGYCFIQSLATVEIEAKDRVALCNRIVINKEATAM